MYGQELAISDATKITKNLLGPTGSLGGLSFIQIIDVEGI